MSERSPFYVWTSTAVRVSGLLALMLVLTWAIGKWDVDRIEHSYEEMISSREAEAVKQIQEDLSRVFREMSKSAKAMASAPELISSFRFRESEAGSREKVVRATSTFEIESRGFVEVYDHAPVLLAWNGPVFPIDDGVNASGFMTESLEGVVRDGAERTALVVWEPIRDGTQILGALRLGTMVEVFMPIRNDYLRDYTWGETWTRKLGFPVEFEFGSSSTKAEEGFHSLVSPLGKQVGRVLVSPASALDLTEERAGVYRDIMAFWLTLLLGWIITLATRKLWISAGATSDPFARIKMAHLGGYFLLLAGARWVLLWAHIPSRWQTGKAPLAPLFDPQHLASVFGMGALRTIGDLFITSLFLMLAGLVFLRLTAAVRERAINSLHFDSAESFTRRMGIAIGIHQLIAIGIAWFTYSVASHAVMDSTLDLFARSGLLPDRLTLVVFSALLLVVFFAILMGGRLVWVLTDWLRLDLSRLPGKAKLMVWFLTSTIFVSWLFSVSFSDVPWQVFLGTTFALVLAAAVSPIQPARSSPIVSLRHFVPIILGVSLILFPMLEMSEDAKVRIRMLDAAESFQEDKDARVMFALAQVLDASASTDFAREFVELESLDEVERRFRLDSLAEESTRGFLLTALASYDVTITLHEPTGRVLGRYSNRVRRMPRATRDAADRSEFELFGAMYSEFGSSGSMIEKLTGMADQNRFRYAGFQGDPSGLPLYVLVRAEQRSLSESASTPFPKVLTPAGYYGDRYTDFSIAEFRDGVLVRSQGQSFGKSFLDPNILDQLRGDPELWISERIRDRDYNTLYNLIESPVQRAGSTVIAIRRRTTNFFDQLYHLLRVVVAGLFLAGPVYFGGLIWRLKKKGRATNQPKRFRDRVLNAFFSVGIVTVLAMGFVGLEVVTGETDRAIESWLKQHLERVEETLLLEAKGEELPYRVLDRISVDSLSARVGLDLIVYHFTEVDQASRPELIRDRLIEKRLPLAAYEALFFDGFKFVSVDEELGSFAYTAGYRSLTDERGTPHYVVSIPTLPEQERIEEERARTIAYLFGALLLLVLVVMVTASLLANALTRPIVQLRAGLQSVAAGHFERIADVDSQDEIADLVDSFNTMQDQLEESQQLVGEQQRQLAWREMARQVAHEIKNPLTPMKLSIQHLRAAFGRRSEDGSDDEKFARKFSQTTTTLIEQVDALARIANEFSSFGRMPTHIREEVDLHRVISEAVELMQAEENVSISLRLDASEALVHGDREALRRVYINFLKNAIQAVPEERSAVIEVSTAIMRNEKGPFIESRVRDNGNGIARNLWDRIFVPSFSTKTSGTGLGLAIAKKTVENMDGEIGFDTRLDEGTTFWIKVPLV